MKVSRIAAAITGGGSSVVSTYLSNFKLSVEAGFVCQPSGTKYKCTAADLVELQKVIDTAIKFGILTDIVILDWYNQRIYKDLATLQHDMSQLTTNLKQLMEHNYHA
ncbi:MAG: hypothetical protein WC967_15565 [Balneolaceae bacterium]